MCGIAGGVGTVDGDALDAMASRLVHRGPDSRGTYVEDDAMLASRRLRVIDLESGDQPITNEDGDVVVVYNGEIYNFRSLRDDLEDEGHVFTTDTDTEVLVHGYEEHGEAIFDRLNGMFAAAIWDADRGRLLLGRDRMGVKPLYTAVADDTVLFASEPKAILAHHAVEASVDDDALRYFLQMRYGPPDGSLFEDVVKVAPGSIVSVDVAGEGPPETSARRLWSLGDAPTSPPDDPVGAVRDALATAVERQLVSDVPVGFYLSGGLDTSSVVAMAADAHDEPIHTFCMGFADGEWDERDDARAVADHFGTEHHEITIEDDFMRDFPEMIWHADEPKRNLYPYYVAEEMADHVTVALGGLGSDELFGGYVYRYNRLREYQRLRAWMDQAEDEEAIPAIAERLYRHQIDAGDLANDDVLEHLSALRHLDDPAELYVVTNSSDVLGDTEVYDDRVFGETLIGGTTPSAAVRDRHEPGNADSVEAAMAWDATVKLPDDFLLVEDRMSMAHSLESRVPFLDNDLVDVALSLGSDVKLGTDRRDVGKAVLRRAMRDTLPDQVFEKEKQGFTMPTYAFARDEMLLHARAILDDPHVVREGYVDGTYLEDLLARDPAESLTPHYKMLWKVVATEIWYQMYVAGDASGPEPLESYYT